MSAATDGTIGVPVLRRTRLILDYQHSRAILEPQQGFDVPDSVDASGLTLRRDVGADNAITVAYVIKGSAGDSADIRVGDQLLRIDGVNVGSPNAQSARDLLRAAGKTRQLVLRRGADTLTVSLHLRMVI